VAWCTWTSTSARHPRQARCSASGKPVRGAPLSSARNTTPSLCPQRPAAPTVHTQYTRSLSQRHHRAEQRPHNLLTPIISGVTAKSHFANSRHNDPITMRKNESGKLLNQAFLGYNASRSMLTVFSERSFHCVTATCITRCRWGRDNHHYG
jgi:hypothetical protein